MLRKFLSLLVLFVITLTLFNSTPLLNSHFEQSVDTNSSSSVEGIRSSYVTSNSYPIPMNITGNSYSAPHTGFSVASNSELLTLRDSETWAGTGSVGDPIVITGYNFTSTSNVLLSISNTNLHFKIDGNFFRVPTENYYGVSLSNVTNGNITNNYFDKADFGVNFNDVNFTSVHGNHFTSLVGTYITSGQNNSISDNYFNTTDTSVMLYSSSNTTFHNIVYNNTFKGSAYGVYLWSAFKNEITLNNFTQTSIYSIYLYQTTAAFNVITENIIQDVVGSGFTGIFVSSYSHNNTISRNNITNVTIGIRLSYADNNTVFDNSIENTTQAISVESSQYNRVYQNNISNVADGFLGAYALILNKGGNNTLFNNNVNDTDHGVQIYQSSQNVLHGFNISANRGVGVTLLTASFNDIFDCNIEGGTTGFHFTSSSTNNTLIRNTLQLLNQGIQLQSTSHYNTFIENRIENATNYGIDSTSSSYLTIYNNTIMHSGLRGINIAPSSYPIIAFNVLYNNGQYGLYLNTGLGSKIYNNTIKFHSSAGAYLISTNQHNISFNTFANSTIGLSLVLSDPGYVIGNTFANNSDTGLFLDGTDGLYITDNLFEHSGNQGLRLSISDGNVIANNTIRDSTMYGIVAESTSNTNFIMQNEIRNNALYAVWLKSGPNDIRLNNISGSGVGIYVDTSNTNTIESNRIEGNTDGIRLVDSDSNSILLNMIFNNSQYGIYSESGFPEENNGNKIYNNSIVSNGVYGVWLYATARTAEVKWNDFINNTENARDSNPSAYLNVWDENFYDDWDQVQSYYSIIGINIRDYNPSPLPLYPLRFHFMLPATIMSPTGGSDYPGDITITWNSAYDSYGHSITYDLYYSNNTGSNWYSIVSGLTNSSFYWNATSFPEGSEYQVRVVASDTTNTTTTSETGSFSIDPQAPRLGVVPSSFTVEISWDPMPVLNFSAFDDNPDLAYIEWLGFEMSDPVF